MTMTPHAELGLYLRAAFEAELDAQGVRLEDSERELVLTLCVAEYCRDLERARVGDAVR